MNSIGVAGATWISHTTRPVVDLLRRVGRLVAAHPVGLVRGLAPQRPAAERLHQHAADGASDAEPQELVVRVEHERLGDAPDRTHDAVHEPAVRDVPAVARGRACAAPHTSSPPPMRSRTRLTPSLERDAACSAVGSGAARSTASLTRAFAGLQPEPRSRSSRAIDAADVADRVGGGIAVRSASGQVRGPQPRKVRGDGPLVRRVGDGGAQPVAPRARSSAASTTGAETTASRSWRAGARCRRASTAPSSCRRVGHAQRSPARTRARSPRSRPAPSMAVRSAASSSAGSVAAVEHDIPPSSGRARVAGRRRDARRRTAERRR